MESIYVFLRKYNNELNVYETRPARVFVMLLRAYSVDTLMAGGPGMKDTAAVA